MSATSGTVTAVAQLAGVNVIVGATRVIVCVPFESPNASSSVSSSVLSNVGFVPRTIAILKYVRPPSIEIRCPSRKPSARKLPLSFRVIRRVAVSTVTAPVKRPWPTVPIGSIAMRPPTTASVRPSVRIETRTSADGCEVSLIA